MVFSLSLRWLVVPRVCVWSTPDFCRSTLGGMWTGARTKIGVGVDQHPGGRVEKPDQRRLVSVDQLDQAGRYLVAPATNDDLIDFDAQGQAATIAFAEDERRGHATTSA